MSRQPKRIPRTLALRYSTHQPLGPPDQRHVRSQAVANYNADEKRHARNGEQFQEGIHCQWRKPSVLLRTVNGGDGNEEEHNYNPKGDHHDATPINLPVEKILPSAAIAMHKDFPDDTNFELGCASTMGSFPQGLRREPIAARARLYPAEEVEAHGHSHGLFEHSGKTHLFAARSERWPRRS